MPDTSFVYFRRFHMAVDGGAAAVVRWSDDAEIPPGSSHVCACARVRLRVCVCTHERERERVGWTMASGQTGREFGEP